MTPTYFCCLEKGVPTRTARLDFKLPSATYPHEQSCKSCRRKSSRRATIVIEPRSVNGCGSRNRALRKAHRSEARLVLASSSVYAGCMLSRMTHLAKEAQIRFI